MKRKKRILVAPLDWGLGHTTRSIPIINELLQRDADVIIAADNRPFDLLRREFPDLPHVRFPGYSVQYQQTGNLHGKIIRQLPKILNGFRTEHHYLDALIKLHDVDAVISDNRFGAFSTSVPSVLIIHQLNIILPSLLAFGKGIVAFANRKLCNNFSEVWIPDFESEPNIAGIMAHPKRLPKNAYYVGPLSRIRKIDARKEIDILVILSGPEPQRTILEELIVGQLMKTGLISVIVRGKPEQNTTMKISPTITMVNSVQTDEMSRLIAASHMIISRPGHSTIMDLSFVGAKAILVNLPGQTEQEYLARMLKKQMICYYEDQDDFDLLRSLERAGSYSGFNSISNDLTILRERIDNLIGS
jgi:uncharacterized protein (TIGR00661 family)